MPVSHLKSWGKLYIGGLLLLAYIFWQLRRDGDMSWLATMGVAALVILGILLVTGLFAFFSGRPEEPFFSYGSTENWAPNSAVVTFPFAVSKFAQGHGIAAIKSSLSFVLLGLIAAVAVGSLPLLWRLLQWTRETKDEGGGYDRAK